MKGIEMNKIIGLSGKMQSGKSTVAYYLHGAILCEIRTMHPFSQGFADELKDTVNVLFACPANDKNLCFDYQEDKEKIHAPTGKTYRQLLQEVGCLMRSVYRDVWVDNAFCNIPYRDSAVHIIPDVRFQNEIDGIHKRGGIVIRLTRNPINSDDHSETALDNAEFDYVVDNQSMTIEQTNDAVWRIVKEYLTSDKE